MGWYHFANIIGHYWQFPMASIHDATKPDRSGTSISHQCIHGRTNRSAGVKNIVDQDDIPLFNIEWNLRCLYFRHAPFCTKIIAVKGYIQHPEIRFPAKLILNDGADALADIYPTGLHTDERQGLWVVERF